MFEKRLEISIFQLQLDFLMGIVMKGFISSILLVLFVLSMSSSAASWNDLGASFGAGDRIIICMDMMDLEFPGEDDAATLGLPPMEPRKELSPAPAQKPLSPNELDLIKKRKESNIQEKAGEDKKSKFKARVLNRPDPSYSPELSPFFYPLPSKKINKSKMPLKPVEKKKPEIPEKDFSLELKEVTLPKLPPAKINKSSLDKKKKRPGQQASPRLEMPLLGEMPRGQQPTDNNQQQKPNIIKPVIKPRAVPERGRKYIKAPLLSEERQPPPSPEPKGEADPKLLEIYEKFYKK